MSGIAELLADPATSDDAVARAAAAADGAGAAAELELVARDEARLLRHPAIVAALFQNPRAPMALVNQTVALCARAGVRVEQIPSFDEVADAILGDLVAESKPEDAGVAAADPDAAAGPTSDAAAFDDALAESRRQGDGDAAGAEVESAPDGASPTAAAAPARPRKGAVIDFGKLKLFEKIRLATLGNAFCRQTLLRDSNRLVAMAAIRSPGITEMEVIRAAGNRAVSEDVIRYIANSKEYVKLYPVKMSLIGNPKCPLALTLKMLPHLRPEDLKNIARSKNIPSALSAAAKKLSATRSTTSS